MFAQEPDDVVCDQTAVGGEGIAGLFCTAILFFVKERNGLPYQVETEERLAPVKIQVERIGQKRQKKTSAFFAVANVIRSRLFVL